MTPKKIIGGLTAAILLFSAAVTPISASYAENAADDVMPVSIYTDDVNTYTEDEYEIMHSPTYHEEINEEFFSDLTSDISYFSLEPEPLTFKNSFYEQLDEESQFIYEIMLENLRDKYNTGKIIIPLTKNFVNTKSFINNANKWVCSVLWPAFNALLYDHPEMSWLRMMNYSWSYSYFNKSDQIIKLHNLEITFEETGVYFGTYADIEKAVSTAVKEINTARGNDKSIYNTLLQINNYLCRKITYNYPAADESDPAYTDEQREIYQTAYSAFYPCNGDKQVKTVCAGYARGFKVLCDVYGIPCVVARGDSYSNGVNKGPHAWNYVKVGNDWWAVDVTWNDNGNSDKASSNNYFLVAANDMPDSATKETFEQSHRAERPETGLESTLFQYPALKGAGAKAELKNECTADSAAAKVRSGDGDLNKMGAEAGMPIITDTKGNILIRPDTFPDQDLRNWVSENIDSDKSGNLSAKEVSAVTNINISKNGIAYLNGIEFFTSLKNLNCSDNIIESIDVSNHTALTTLDCSGNNLTSLDVINNISLENLNCSNNLLESLDLLNNTALTSLNYFGNPIKSFTLPVIPAVFPDDIFRKWIIENIDTNKSGILSSEEINAVKSINVSDLGIFDLKGIECFISLTELNCSKNNLIDLDISSNSELVSIDVTENSLETIDISNNSALRHLNTDVVYITGPDTDLISVNGVIFITATAFPDKNFRFCLSKIADEGNDGELYPDELINIKSIDVSDFEISDLSGIEYLTYLTVLECSGNNISYLDVSKNPGLTTLDCSCNHLTSLDISKNTVLTSLNCSINKFESIDVSSNTALTTLNCYGNYLTSLDVSKNTALANLNCSINKIDSLDLSNNTVLKTLNCSSNQLKSLDLSKNTELVNIDYSNNPITDFKPVPDVTTTVPATTEAIVTTEIMPISTTVPVTTQPETTSESTIIPITTAAATSVETTTVLTTTAETTTAQILTTVSDSTTSSTAAATETTSITRPATETTTSTVLSEVTTSFTAPATAPTTTTVHYGSVVTKVSAEIKADMIADIPEGEELLVMQEGCKFVFDPSSVENIKKTIGNKDISLDYNVVDKDDIKDKNILAAIEECDAVLSFVLSDADGEEIIFSSEEGGAVTVTVPYEAPAGTKNIEVYNVDPDGAEKITNAAYDPVNKTVTFSAESSSYYAVKAINESGETLKKPELPQTGNNVPTNYVMTVSAIIFTVTGAFAMIKSGVARRRKENITK